MSDCHRLGIKNFKTIRYPNQIKLAFELSTDDISAPRYVSSKDNDYNYQKINPINFDYFPIKKPINDGSRKYQYSKLLMNFIISILYWIFRVLNIILKYAICVIWCLFKIFRCTIFRVLTEPKRCHPVQFYHHHHY